MSPREISISTLKQFDAAIKELRQTASHEGRVLLYRGQIKRYFERGGTGDNLRPNMCRENAPAIDLQEKQRFLDAFGQYLLAEAARDAALPDYWAKPVTVMREGVEISILNVTALDKVPHTWVALLQHYEVPTEMLDVTVDPYVALAFGLWPFKYPPPPLQRTGVVYVFALPAAAVGRPLHIDLQPLFTWDASLRPVRQNGSLLSELYDDPNAQQKNPNLYASYLAAILVLGSGDALRRQFLKRRPNMTEEYLFPSNQEDRLYRFLLDAQHSKGAKTFTISVRKGNRPGLPLFETIPAIEPLTGSLEIGRYGQIRRSRRFREGSAEAFLIMNLYAGDTPEIRRAQENIARILGVIGRERRLRCILCDNLDRGASPGVASQFDRSAFSWYWNFGRHLPADVPILGIDNRRRAQAHADEFQKVRGLGANRAALLEDMRTAMSAPGARMYPADVWALDEVGTKFYLDQQIGRWDLWMWFVRELAASARKQGVSLDVYPIFAFFAVLYGLERTPRPPTTPPADQGAGSPSKPWLTNVVSELLRSPEGMRELGEAIVRVLEHLAIEQSVFERTFAGQRFINVVKLQLYLVQHHLMTLVTDAEDLLRELLLSTGGRLGQVDLILRVLAELYRLELGFDTYLKIRKDWKRHSLGYVYARAPQLFPVALGRRERKEFDRERDRLFKLWKIVLRRYEESVATASKALKAGGGTYALVVNGAYRPLFEAMLEENGISYSTIEPRS